MRFNTAMPNKNKEDVNKLNCKKFKFTNQRNLYLALCVFGALLIYLGISIYNYWPSLDNILLKEISSTRSNYLTELSFICSWAGNYFVAPVTIITAAIFGVRKEWHYFVEMVSPVILATLSCTFIKAIVMRPRPITLGFDALVDEPFFSFPSGHTTGTSVMVLAFLIVLWQTSSKLVYKIALTTLGIAFASSVAWSRMYNAVHFPSDIIGSFGLVFFFSFATLYLVESCRTKC